MTDKQRLRKSLEDFAKGHEAISEDLQRAADPSVERLLESFCYLSTQVQSEIARLSPRVALQLLNTLWPAALRDFPAQSILKCVRPNENVHLSTETVFSSSHNDETVFLSPVIAMTVSPLNIVKTELLDNALRVSLSLEEGAELPDALVFYIDPDANAALNLQFSLMKSLKACYVVAAGEKNLLSAACHPKPLFQLPDDLFEFINRYFVYPSHFLFFSMSGLNQCLKYQKEFALEFVFDQFSSLHFSGQAILHLHCVPVANRFSSPCEPIYVNAKAHQYPLYCDAEQARFLALQTVSAKTLLGKTVSFQSPTDYVIQRFDEGYSLTVELSKITEPLVVSVQAFAQQGEAIQGIAWRSEQFSSSALSGTLLHKPSAALKNDASKVMALLSAYQQNIHEDTTLAVFKQFIRAHLMRFLPGEERLIAGIVSFSGEAIFRVEQSVIRPLIRWKIQLNPDCYSSASAMHQFLGFLECVIQYFRPLNYAYDIQLQP